MNPMNHIPQGITGPGEGCPIKIPLQGGSGADALSQPAVDWRACPRCGVEWPHPSERSEVKCWPCIRAESRQAQPADVDALAQLRRHGEGDPDVPPCICDPCKQAYAHLAPALAPTLGVDAPSHAKMLDHITEPAEPFRLDTDSVRFRSIVRWLGTSDAEQQAIGKIALRALAARNVLRQAKEAE